MIFHKPIENYLEHLQMLKAYKVLFLLNVFLCLAIFLKANETFPFIIKSTGAVNLQFMESGSSNNIIVAGTFTNTISYQDFTLSSKGEEDLFLLHLNSNGTLIWMKSFGGIFEEDISSLHFDGQNIWLAGGFRNRAQFDSLNLASPDGSRSLFLLNVDEKGKILQHRQFDGQGLKSIKSIIVDRDNEIILGAYFQGALTYQDTSWQSKGNTDILILKLSDDLSLDWNLQTGSLGNNRLEQLIRDSENNLIFAGTFDNQIILGGDTLKANTLDKDVFVAQLDDSGNFAWSLKAGGVFDKEIVRLATDEEGNIYGAGQLVGIMKFNENISIQSQNGNTDMYWFQLSSEGAPLQAFSYGGVLAENITDMEVDASSFYLSGSFQGNFELQNESFDAGDGVGSFVIQLNLQNGELEESQNLPGEQFVFINQILINKEQKIVAGSFGGLLDLNDQMLNSGSFFYGVLGNLFPMTTSIEELPSFRLNIYPNPFHQSLFLESPEVIEELMIYDRLGRLKIRKKHPGQELYLPELEKGIYLIRTRSMNKYWNKQWVIKN